MTPVHRKPQAIPILPSTTHWLSYCIVTNIDAAVAQATASGAKVHVPATNLGGGLKFAILVDPQGAAFGLMTAM